MSAYKSIEANGGGKLIYTNAGSLKSCISNAALIYKYHPEWIGKIGFDTFSIRVTKLDVLPCGSLPGAWMDIDCTRAMIWLSDNFGFCMSESVTQRVFELIADDFPFSPVVNYLRSLEWDGTQRVGSWLTDYFGVIPSPAVDIFQKVTLVGAVARAIEPGCKNDTALVIEGRQGIGKSTGICALAGKDWFTDAPIEFGSKDGYMVMRGHWFIEWAEMSSHKNSDSARIRAFLSQIRDEYRPPYGRNIIEVPRQCIFICTVNGHTYLTDSTGNRRFMPVEATKVDVDGIAANRDQIWAEAYYLYSTLEDHKWWFEFDNADVLAVQESRFDCDPWEDVIIQFLELNSHLDKVHSDSLYEVIGLDVGKLRRAEFTRIKLIMEHLGWLSGRPYINGSQRRGFHKIALVDSSANIFTDVSF